MLKLNNRLHYSKQKGITRNRKFVLNDVTESTYLLFYRGENNRFYLVVWKYLFSWLLHNLLIVEMLFHIQKLRLTLRLFYFKQHFSTSERIINRKTRALLNYTWSLHFILFKRLFGLLVGCLIVYIFSYV